MSRDLRLEWPSRLMMSPGERVEPERRRDLDTVLEILDRTRSVDQDL